MRNNSLIEVFEDTQRHPIFQYKGYSSFHEYTWKAKFDKPKETSLANIIFLNEDCLLTVSKYITNHPFKKTCLLNMASYKTPGGGVKKGSMAQEEELARRTNLMYHIDKSDFYPLELDEYIYSKSIRILKNPNYENINMDNSMGDFSVISVPAIKISEFEGTKDEYEFYTDLKIQTIFEIPKQNDVKNIILSAFGCGAYKNDPHYIASIFKKYIQIYKPYYENIIFSIIQDSNSVANNFEIFKKIILDEN